MLTHFIHYTAADCISLHGLCRASFRDAVSFRQRLPRRAQNCTLLAMTNLAGFEGKRNVHSGWKRLYPTKNVRFPNKSVPNLCHCEAAERPWQSLSQRHGIPERSTEARSKKKPLSQKNGFTASFRFLSLYLWFCFVPRNHSSFRDGKSFR